MVGLALEGSHGTCFPEVSVSSQGEDKGTHLAQLKGLQSTGLDCSHCWYLTVFFLLFSPNRLACLFINIFVIMYF